MSNRSKAYNLLQGKFRSLRMKILESEISNIYKRNGGKAVSILDIGGRGGYWRNLSEEMKGSVDITILNLPGDLSHPIPSDIRIRLVSGDACSMPQFDDNEFDLSHSNSVIEHVGSYYNMVLFAKEAMRVGVRHFIQTPNFFFPFEPHHGKLFVHWKGDLNRIRKVTKGGLGYARARRFADACKYVDHTTMIDLWMFKNLFPRSLIKKEKFLFLLNKSFIAIGES